MSWGIFKKIGQGIKKGFNWVKDHIVKPVAKFIAPVAKPLGGVVKTLIPGSAPIVDLAEGAVEKLSGGIRVPVDDGDWAKAFDQSRTLNRRIQLK